MTKIKCPACKCLESATAEVCRACGAGLHDRPQNQKIVTKAKCTACGCLESASAEVCRACGAALQSVPVQEISFAQAVAGIFSRMEGKGFHGIDNNSPLSDDNIFEDSGISMKPPSDHAELLDLFERASISALEDLSDIHENRYGNNALENYHKNDDLLTNPAFSNIPGNVFYED